VPSAGFAIGFDRVVVSLRNVQEIAVERWPVVMVITQGKGRELAFSAARAFRDAGTEIPVGGAGYLRPKRIVALVDLTEQNINKKMSHAAKVADFAVIIGDREAAAGTVTLKDLHTGDQEPLSLGEAVTEVMKSGPR
jgi:histidyl-tRNA synthetase